MLKQGYLPHQPIYVPPMHGARLQRLTPSSWLQAVFLNRLTVARVSTMHLTILFFTQAVIQGDDAGFIAKLQWTIVLSPSCTWSLVVRGSSFPASSIYPQQRSFLRYGPLAHIYSIQFAYFRPPHLYQSSALISCQPPLPLTQFQPFQPLCQCFQHFYHRVLSATTGRRDGNTVDLCFLCDR